MDSYLRPYLPLLIYAILVAVTGVVLLMASQLLGPRRRMVEKDSPYECGVPLVGGSRERFSIKFYLIAILFVLFDIETIFLVPWAVVFRRLGLAGILEMFVFMAFLILGFVYAWKRGGLDWE